MKKVLSNGKNNKQADNRQKSLVDEGAALKQTIARSSERLDEIKDQLLASGIREIETGRYVYTRLVMPRRHVIDTKALREDMSPAQLKPYLRLVIPRESYTIRPVQTAAKELPVVMAAKSKSSATKKAH